jgi:hypothetical protein
MGYLPLNDRAPAWLRDIARFLAIRPQFVLSGNVDDYVLMPAGNMALPLTLKDAVASLLEVFGYEFLLCYDPFDHFLLHTPNPEKIAQIKSATGLNLDTNGHVEGSSRMLIETMRKIVTLRSPRGCLLIEHAPRLGDEGQRELYGTSLKLMQTAVQLPMTDGRARFNPVFWVIENTNELPAWFALRNERIRIQTIQHPEVGIRERAAAILVTGLSGFEETPEAKRRDLVESFARSTEGFKLAGLVSTVQLAKDQGYPFADILDAVQLYKLGVTDNPWKQEKLHDLIGNAETELVKQVKGQHQAVVKTVDILRRSVMGLSGAQASAEPASGRPRGVLFFAGPTGVGKTELAKAMSKLLFGNENAYIRFDMSEFAQEHTDARLIGSPPGYVGHFQGGELTKAIQKRPFSVVLFDEIEKAHPRILDKFLQILEDGRLTDGQGITAYFSEAIIVFTSNLGIYVDGPGGARVENVNPSMEYDEVEIRIRASIEDFFKYKLVRPEILNRLGDNIVVFNFITPEVAKQIFQKQLLNVQTRVQACHGLTLEIAPEVIEKLTNLCTNPETLANGGRGIGNRIETLFVNPLSRALFDRVANGPAIVNVTDIETVDGISSVKLV